MAAILKFKKMFNAQREGPPAFKHHHFLNLLPKTKMSEIQLFSESDQIEKMLPSLTGKNVLFFDDGNHKYVMRKIQMRSPATLLIYSYGNKKPETQQEEGGFFITGNLNRLPLRKNYFDVVVCPFSLETSRVSQQLLTSLCAVLKNGGRFFLSVRHPQLEHLLYNQNPSEAMVSDSAVSQYFNSLKRNCVYTEDMIEGGVDASLKPFFVVEGEFDHYQEYKNTPITLLFKAVKFVKSAR